MYQAILSILTKIFRSHPTLSNPDSSKSIVDYPFTVTLWYKLFLLHVTLWTLRTGLIRQ
jgi:hypothetical protein